MFIDEETHKSLYSVNSDQNILENGIWRVVLVHNMPYLDARRNGKVILEYKNCAHVSTVAVIFYLTITMSG